MKAKLSSRCREEKQIKFTVFILPNISKTLFQCVINIKHY